jgi:hypothetical protein
MESTLTAYCKDGFLDSFMSFGAIKGQFSLPSLRGGGGIGGLQYFLNACAYKGTWLTTSPVKKY